MVFWHTPSLPTCDWTCYLLTTRTCLTILPACSYLLDSVLPTWISLTLPACLIFCWLGFLSWVYSPPYLLTCLIYCCWPRLLNLPVPAPMWVPFLWLFSVCLSVTACRAHPFLQSCGLQTPHCGWPVPRLVAWFITITASKFTPAPVQIPHCVWLLLERVLLLYSSPLHILQPTCSHAPKTYPRCNWVTPTWDIGSTYWQQPTLGSLAPMSPQALENLCSTPEQPGPVAQGKSSNKLSLWPGMW